MNAKSCCIMRHNKLLFRKMVGFQDMPDPLLTMFSQTKETVDLHPLKEILIFKKFTLFVKWHLFEM